MKRPLVLLAVVCLSGGLVVASPEASTPAHAAGPMVSAAALLAQLPVLAENTSSYTRSDFGYASDFDADGDGCGTRKEVLKRDAVTLTSVSRSCAVYGTWTSLYDGRTTSDANTLEVDHLVALSEAWDSGAQLWTSQQRIAFGNDVGYKWDLQAVTSVLNQDKGDKDPADWMPGSNRCTYIAAWIGVKARWKLSVDPRERSVLDSFLAACGALQVEQPGTPDVAALSGVGGGVAPTPPVVMPAPPVVVPAPPVTVPVPPSATPTPAPPAVKQKDRTTVSVSHLKRAGKKLTATVTLTNQHAHKRVIARLTLQRHVGSGWRTVATVRTGRFVVTTARASFRLVYAGGPALAASTSKTFKK